MFSRFLSDMPEKKQGWLFYFLFSPIFRCMCLYHEVGTLEFLFLEHCRILTWGFCCWHLWEILDLGLSKFCLFWMFISLYKGIFMATELLRWCGVMNPRTFMGLPSSFFLWVFWVIHFLPVLFKFLRGIFIGLSNIMFWFFRILMTVSLWILWEYLLWFGTYKWLTCLGFVRERLHQEVWFNLLKDGLDFYRLLIYCYSGFSILSVRYSGSLRVDNFFLVK